MGYEWSIHCCGRSPKQLVIAALFILLTLNNISSYECIVIKREINEINKTATATATTPIKGNNVNVTTIIPAAAATNATGIITSEQQQQNQTTVERNKTSSHGAISIKIKSNLTPETTTTITILNDDDVVLFDDDTITFDINKFYNETTLPTRIVHDIEQDVTELTEPPATTTVPIFIRPDKNDRKEIHFSKTDNYPRTDPNRFTVAADAAFNNHTNNNNKQSNETERKNLIEETNFDETILTTPYAAFFDDEHYYDDSTDANHKHDNHTHDEEPDFFHVTMDIKPGTSSTSIATTTEHHSWIYYNTAKIDHSQYDVATNEIRNASVNGIDGGNVTATTTEKRAKYLQQQSIDGYGINNNLTIPGTTDLWELAGLKNIFVEKNKTKDDHGQIHHTPSFQSIGTRQYISNDTIVSKQLADWVEVMKNDVFSNHSFAAPTSNMYQNNISSHQLNVINATNNQTNNHHGVSSEIVATTAAPQTPVPTIVENKLHVTKVHDDNILSENKLKPDELINTTNVTSPKFNSTIGKNTLPNEDELNAIKRNELSVPTTITSKKIMIVPTTTTAEATSIATMATTTTPPLTTAEPFTITTLEPEVISSKESNLTILEFDTYTEIGLETTIPESTKNPDKTTIMESTTTTMTKEPEHTIRNEILTSTVNVDINRIDNAEPLTTTTTPFPLSPKKTHSPEKVHLNNTIEQQQQHTINEPNEKSITTNEPTDRLDNTIEGNVIGSRVTKRPPPPLKPSYPTKEIQKNATNLNRKDLQTSSTITINGGQSVNMSDDSITTITSAEDTPQTQTQPAPPLQPPFRTNIGSIMPTDMSVIEIDEDGTEFIPTIYPTLGGFMVGSTGGSGDSANITPSDGADVNAIIAASVSVVGIICLILLVVFLMLMRKRQKQLTYGQRCRPVGLDAYSLDNVSVYNSVRRKGLLRASKRSYGNAAFDDPTLKNNTLNVAGLAQFIQNKNALYDEFRDLPVISSRADEVPSGCERKNRYANVVPLPETRVFLKRLNNDDQSEYINANYVKLPKDSSTYYIACQAPLEHTIADFWRMIWEQHSRVIIMLTDLHENGIEKCAEYLPPSIVLDNHLSFGDFTVTLKNREVKDKYAISTIHLSNAATTTWREITHLWYQWPDVGVPSDETTIVAMLLEARSYLKMAPPDQSECIMNANGDGNDGDMDDKSDKDHETAIIVENGNNTNIMENGNLDKSKSLPRMQGPLTVHCSPGTGRTGTIIACDIAIRQLENPTRTVDIPQIVYCVRRGRASSVQTREQYEFIYKVANMYATKLTGPLTEI